MNTRKPLNTALAILAGVSAVGLLITLVLGFTMPDDWEYQTAADGVRRLCFIGLVAGGAVRAMSEYQAKKQAEAAAAVETAPPARLRKAKAK